MLHTDGLDAAGQPLAGYGITFTIGRGNDIVCMAAREIVNRLIGRDVDQMVADIAGLEGALAVGWNHRHRVPEGLVARITAVTGLLRQAVTTEAEAAPADAGPSALGAGRILSFVASGVLLGLTEALVPASR